MKQDSSPFRRSWYYNIEKQHASGVFQAKGFIKKPFSYFINARRGNLSGRNNDIYRVKKPVFYTALFLCLSVMAHSQTIDSITFHLYTDSLKKGQHNYINVDGKLSNGKWLPLSEKEISFSCAEASFQGNELIIPEDFKMEKLTIKAFLKQNTAMKIEKTIWIKQMPDPPLPTEDDRSGKPYRKNKRN
jgi:hypothetical protein